MIPKKSNSFGWFLTQKNEVEVVTNLGRSNNDMKYWKYDYAHYLDGYVVSCSSCTKNLEWYLSMYIRRYVCERGDGLCDRRRPSVLPKDGSTIQRCTVCRRILQWNPKNCSKSPSTKYLIFFTCGHIVYCIVLTYKLISLSGF